MNVEHWMTRNPEVLAPEESALDALERMNEGGFRHLPVVNEPGAPIGMVSIDDLRAALPFDVAVGAALQANARAVARNYKIAELMTYLPIAVRTTTPLKEAVNQLAQHRIGCLPVTDPRGVLVGIFTEIDALRAFVALLAGSDDSRALPHPPARNERARELAQVVDELRAERARLATALGQKERQGLAFEGNLAALAGWRLGELAQAIDHVDEGVFGRCSTCGRDIPVTRLHVLPGTRHCVRCARAAANQSVAP
jgi:CBS domain-containing protein